MPGSMSFCCGSQWSRDSSPVPSAERAQDEQQQDTSPHLPHFPWKSPGLRGHLPQLRVCCPPTEERDPVLSPAAFYWEIFPPVLTTFLISTCPNQKHPPCPRFY